MLQERAVPFLGMWHVLKNLHEVVWRRFLATVFAPAFHALFPRSRVFTKPKLLTLQSFLTHMRLAYAGGLRDQLSHALLAQDLGTDARVDLQNLQDLLEVIIPTASLCLLSDLVLGGSGRAFSRVRVGRAFSRVRVGRAFSRVRVGSAFSRVRVGRAFSRVRVGSAFSRVRVGSAFSRVRVGSAFSRVRVGSAFSRVRVGRAFSRVRVGRAFSRVRVGRAFSRVRVGRAFSRVRVGGWLRLCSHA
jgi:hypothetical protein